MSDEAGKRMAKNYEITQAVRIGGKEVVFGVDETNAEPYISAPFIPPTSFFMNTAIAWWAITLPR